MKISTGLGRHYIIKSYYSPLFLTYLVFYQECQNALTLSTIVGEHLKNQNF